MTVDNFLNDIDELPLTWDYFANFDKIKNLDKYKKEIKALNELLGICDIDKIDKALWGIVCKYPKTVNILLLMIALRHDKIRSLNIYNPYMTDEKTLLINLKKNKKALLYFFEESGIKELFIKGEISDIYTYLCGVEIGLDSNGRKNRTGTLMENATEIYIKDFCERNGYNYYTQINIDRIYPCLNINKKFDFIIDMEDKLIVIEVNNYNTSGSKIKSISEEYILLNEALPKDKLHFVWITNGNGWLQNKGIVKQNLKQLDHFINFKQLKNNYLDGLKEINYEKLKVS